LHNRRAQHQRRAQALQQIGVKLTGEREDDFERIAQIADADGNLLTLAEPPTKITSKPA